MSALEYQKPSPRYYEPFKVIRHIGQAAYCLWGRNMRQSLRFKHPPMFHESKLKKHRCNNPGPWPLPHTLGNQLQVTTKANHVLMTRQTQLELRSWSYGIVYHLRTAADVGWSYPDFYLLDQATATVGGGDRFAHAYWQKLQRRAPKLDGSGAAQTNGPTLIIAVWVQPTEAGPQIFAAGRAERGAWVWLVRVFSGSGELSNGGEREKQESWNMWGKGEENQGGERISKMKK